MPSPSAAGWLSERRRGGVSAGLAAVVPIGLSFGLTLGAGRAPNLNAADYSVIGLGCYSAVYLTLSVLAFTRATHTQIAGWARREGRGTFAQRYVIGTAPGPGASFLFAAASLGVTVVWLPRGDGAAIPHGVRIAIAAVLIAAAWASVVVSFAITFYGDNLVDGGQGLLFPGGADPEWADYVYFAITVTASFATSDVEIASAALRRTVAVNTVVAFVFNTVIVAALVSALASI